MSCGLPSAGVSDVLLMAGWWAVTGADRLHPLVVLKPHLDSETRETMLNTVAATSHTQDEAKKRVPRTFEGGWNVRSGRGTLPKIRH